MSHAFDQKKFSAGYGVGSCSPAADIAHAIDETVDDECGHPELP